MAAALTIRTADADDVAALADLSTQLGYPADASTMRRRLLDVREAGAGEVFVAVDSDGRIVGWTHVVARVYLEDEPFAELAGLVVDVDARGRGVGAILLRTAEDWASAQGLARVRVRSNVVRERAHGFYRREGYVESKRQVVFDKTLT